MSTDQPKKKLPRDAYLALKTELDALRRDGDISPERFDALVERYALKPPQNRDFSALVFLATTTLGTLALGFATFLLLRYHWNYLSPAVKTAIVCGATALAYLGAGVARRFDKTVLAEIATFGGAILFGVDVWQIAQIYQFNVDFPQGAWIWGVGVFLLAVFSRLPITHYLAVAILAIWVGWELLVNVESIWQNFVAIPNAAFSAPIFAALGYFWGVRRRYPSVSILYLVFFAFWAIFQPFVWRQSFAFFFDVFIGGLLWFVGDRLVRDRAVACATKVLGAAIVLGFLIPSAFSEVYRFYGGASKLFAFYYVALAALAVGAAFLATRQSGRRFDVRSLRVLDVCSPTGVAIAAIPALAFCLVFLPAFSGDLSGAFKRFAWTPALYGSVLSVAVAWFFILTGAAGKPGRYWVGVLYFIVWSIARYIDLFGNIGGALGAAFFFAAIAVALYVAAFLFQTRVRARIVESRPNPDAAEPTETTETTETFEAPVETFRENAAPEPNANVLKIGRRVAIVLQFATIFGIVGVQTATFSDARTIRVETAPVDPTDLFRGEYVVLSYPFSNLQGKVWIDGEMRQVFDVSAMRNENGVLRASKSRTVFIRLKRDPADDVYKPVAMTPDRPRDLADDEIAIRGRCKNNWRVVYGIEAFFVQEGRGRELEKATGFSQLDGRREKALVKLLVAPSGKARVADVELVPVDPPKSAAAADAAESL